MTTLVEDRLAHTTDRRFVPKNLIQTKKTFIELAFACKVYMIQQKYGNCFSKVEVIKTLITDEKCSPDLVLLIEKRFQANKVTF